MFVRLCAVFTLDINDGGQNQKANGVNCIDLFNSIFVKDITMVLNSPEFDLSTNDYYYLQPLYKSQSQ